MAVDVQDAGARGLSRRQMIKASAVAGVAAWTAPVVIDSLSSPAAAYSGACQPYVVKLTPTGSVYNACFRGTATICFPASDAKWAGSAPGTSSSSCGASNPTFCPGSSGTASGHLPTVTTETKSGTVYYKVVFSGACGFSPRPRGSSAAATSPAAPGASSRRSPPPAPAVLRAAATGAGTPPPTPAGCASTGAAAAATS